MFRKTIGPLAALAVLGALLCTSVAQPPPGGKIPNLVEEQQKVEPAPPLTGTPQGPGRYQIDIAGNTGTIVLVDTHTGQCWSKSHPQSWRDLGSPIKGGE